MYGTVVRQGRKHTFCGASCNRILALVMMPNWPRPPRTALNRSASLLGEHFTISPRPVKPRESNIKGEKNYCPSVKKRLVKKDTAKKANTKSDPFVSFTMHVCVMCLTCDYLQL